MNNVFILKFVDSLHDNFDDAKNSLKSFIIIIKNCLVMRKQFKNIFSMLL